MKYSTLNFGIQNLLLKLWVPPHKVKLYRDLGLTIPVGICALATSVPIAYWLEDGHASMTEISIGLGSLLLAFLISFISPNRGGILAGSWAFTAFRWGISFLLLRSLKVLAVAIIYVAIGMTCHRLWPDSDE